MKRPFTAKTWEKSNKHLFFCSKFSKMVSWFKIFRSFWIFYCWKYHLCISPHHLESFDVNYEFLYHVAINIWGFNERLFINELLTTSLKWYLEIWKWVLIRNFTRIIINPNLFKYLRCKGFIETLNLIKNPNIFCIDQWKSTYRIGLTLLYLKNIPTLGNSKNMYH